MRKFYIVMCGLYSAKGQYSLHGKVHDLITRPLWIMLGKIGTSEQKELCGKNIGLPFLIVQEKFNRYRSTATGLKHVNWI